tara:strand:- start:52 stop:378 length:327 start_codon:yes stop_codon:yes gene_type:complete
MIKIIMKYLRLLLLIKLTLLIYSCGTIKEGFTNQKKNSSDEFLVEKKSPLIMPPNFDELPLPGSEKDKSNSNDNKIKSLVSNNDDINKKSKDINQSFEESIVEKIKKN